MMSKQLTVTDIYLWLSGVRVKGVKSDSQYGVIINAREGVDLLGVGNLFVEIDCERSNLPKYTSNKQTTVGSQDPADFL
jgi:hypothetical protein